MISPRPMGAAGQSLAAPAPIHHPPSISMTKTLQSPAAHPSEGDVEASKTSFFKDFRKEGTRGRGGELEEYSRLPSQPPRPSIGSWVIRFGQIQTSCPSFFPPTPTQGILPPKSVDQEMENPASLAQHSHSEFLSPSLSWGEGLGARDVILGQMDDCDRSGCKNTQGCEAGLRIWRKNTLSEGWENGISRNKPR